LIQLHEKIKDLEKRRAKNREYIEETSTNYQALKKNIKDFAKTQNIDKKKR
jgi:excinuclease UvrABC helicase subunit UvrB